jgi:phage/plasmid-like protein (TIGR03299 family)
MSANVESMFSSNNKVPWHGIGTIVSESPNSVEALTLAGLNWKVEKRKIFVEDARLNSVNKLVQIPEKFANVRDKDNKVLGIVGSQYKIVQNTEAFDFVDSLLVLGEGKVKYETAGSLNEGRKIWLSTKLPSFELLNDKVDNYVVFTNSFDGSASIRAMITPIRVICNNTLNLAINSATRSWSCVHKGNIENKLEIAKESLGLVENYVNNLQAEAEYLQSQKVDVVELANLILPDNVVDSAKQLVRKREDRMTIIDLTKSTDLIKFGDTAWTFINAVSDFAFHRVPRRQTENYQERTFDYILTGNTLLDKAYQVIRKVA